MCAFLIWEIYWKNYIKRKESHKQVDSRNLHFICIFPQTNGVVGLRVSSFSLSARVTPGFLFAEATLSLLSLPFCDMNTIIRTLQWLQWRNLYYYVMCVNLASKTTPTERRKREEIRLGNTIIIFKGVSHYIGNCICITFCWFNVLFCYYYFIYLFIYNFFEGNEIL